MSLLFLTPVPLFAPSQAVDEPHSIPKDMAKRARRTNIQVANITTPANYFHALRRQVFRPYRKPLVVMSPKSLLRFKGATSTMAEFGEGSEFQRVIPEAEADTLVADDKIRRAIFCSGQVYYALQGERAKRGVDDVAIVRVEQLAPFPWDGIQTELERYNNAEVVWAQEEHENAGAWSFLRNKMQLADVAQGREAKYTGRGVAAAAAAGTAREHNAELKKLLEEAFN